LEGSDELVASDIEVVEDEGREWAGPTCSTPIGVDVGRKQRSKSWRKRKKGTGLTRKTWTREEKEWLFECEAFAGKRRGFLERISNLFHTR
jgi:hypothetical protein